MASIENLSDPLRCWIEVSAGAIRNNFRLFCHIAGKEHTAAVVKSNAYGHGLVEVYRCLEPETPAWLAVNYLSEAELLRRLGFQGRLLVVGPVACDQLARATQSKSEVVLGYPELLEAWLSAPKKPLIHVKIDSGMSRQGFHPKDAGIIAARLGAQKDNVAGICTHFANVEDVLEHQYANSQLQNFNTAVTAFREAGINAMAHAASSASCLLLECSRFDLSRIGISLYGLWPSPATRLSYLQTFKNIIDLQPALRWCTVVSSVKTVSSGQFIGYGCTYRAVKDMQIAVLPVGYFEGFPRLAGTAQSYVLLRGTRCAVVGRICMNMMMVDVSHLPDVKPGEAVTLVGQDGGENLSASELAGWAQTIHYELLPRLLPDIPRRIVP